MQYLNRIIRHLQHAPKQALLFVLCTALSLTSLTAFSGFSQSVGRALLDDARSLHAADIIIKSYDPISVPLNRAIDQLAADQRVRRADLHEFFSVVRTPAENASVLARLKVVSTGYPFYGEVTLGSDRTFKDVLTPGTCIVAPTLLDRIGIQVGDTIKVGLTTLKVVDVVASEPDRALSFVSFGPRVFIHSKDLNALGLISKGGRIQRSVLLKLSDQENIEAVTSQLKKIAVADQEQVDTFQTAGSRIKRFLDNFFFFLKLVGLFILLMAGLGMQGTLSALLKEARTTVAIMKAVGATNRFIWRHFFAMVALMGTAGTALGILCGIGMQHVLGWMMSPYLPANLNLRLSWTGILEGVLLGAVVVIVFSFLPLYRIKAMRPMMIFRKELAPVANKGPLYLSGAMMLLLFFGLVIRHMQDLRFGFYFVGGIIALMAVAAAASQAMLWVAAHRSFAGLTMRQAVKGLFRKGGATRAILVTLTASLSVIFSNYLIERNLDAAFVQSYPESAPNAYFVDIQSDQRETFLKEVGAAATLYPIIRARVTAINDAPVNQQAERKKRRDNFSRVFNLTYRHHLLEDETLVKGAELFRKEWPELQVSILDTVAEMRPMDVGDTISFKIQGVPLKARISSIRSRNQSSFSPFFYFVFPDSVLNQAPQTFFAALKVAPGQLGALQNRVVSRLPNVSVIDLTQTISVFTRLMNQLSQIIRGFSFFSIAAGLLILTSAIYATRAERIVEAVYYKILGAGKKFVFKVFALENLLIGLFAGLPALIIAHAGTYWICSIKLEIEYQLFLLPSAILLAASMLLVLTVGLVASKSIMEKRPAVFLREQADG